MATAKRLPSGNWRVLIYTGKDDKGKRLYQSFTAPTKKEAEYQASMAAISQREKKENGLTLGEAIDRYIEVKESVLSPSTVRAYRSLRHNAFSTLSDVPLSKLSQVDVQRAVSLYAATHAPKTVRNMNALITATLKLFSDAAFTVTLPQKIKPEITIPTNEQVKRLLEAVKGTPMETAIMLGAFLGLRRSELCALTWEDYSAKDKIIRIRKALVYDKYSALVVKSTKTTAGTRDIPVPQVLCDHLDEIKRKGKKGNHITPLTPSAVSSCFIRLSKKLNISCRFHDLRHYQASLLLALGVPDKYAMERMGHATANMLKTVYQHTMKEKEKEVNDSINEKINSFF